MTTCEKCADLGSAHWEPEAQRPRQSAKAKARISVPGTSVRSISLNIPEDVEIAKDYGSRVRKAREKMGLDHEALGRKISEKTSVIRKVESGKIVPDQALAAKLEHMLRIKLFVPFSEPKIVPLASPPSKGVTLGENVHLKGKKEEAQKGRGRS